MRRGRTARRSPQAADGPRPDREITDRIERWYRDFARDLPWRRRRSGYAALVSESMLQQTQVARVVDAFEAFMRRFPTVEALAAADEEAVLAAWRGLGYYRRARNLHAAARMVVRDFRGVVPADAPSLRALPGVGRYTAGAIASIVHGAREPIVDGNVGRVLLRLHGRELATDDRAAQAWLWEEAARLVEAAGDPAAFNEGLMELGAVVCTPMAPRCRDCPLAERCAARAAGSADRIPTPRRAATRRVIRHHAVIFERRGRWLVERRPDTGLWSGMWQAPTVESDDELSPDGVAARLRFPAALGPELARFVHVTTHREVRFVVHAGSTRTRTGRWVDAAELEELPMATAARRAMETGNRIQESGIRIQRARAADS